MAGADAPLPPPDGEVVTRAADGRVTARSTFRGGELDGPALSYDETGEVVQEARFARGKLHGELVVYHAGNRKMSVDFVHGERHGLVTMYDGDGRLSARLPYVAGSMTGIAEFHADGARLRTTTYLDGVEEGEQRDFHPTGEPRERRYLVAGKTEGEVVAWHRNGVVHSRQHVRAGKPLGPPELYDDRGRRLPATKDELPRWKRAVLWIAKKG
ncbi:MAG TPA: hypothetical protein VE913_22835 [Longimicrobium sp.]|nr:hypothetical protein [Longimicrobium sp.]